MTHILSLSTTDVTCIECGGETKRFQTETPKRSGSGNPRVHILHYYECSIGKMLRAYGVHPGIDAGEVSYKKSKQKRTAA